MLIRNCLKARPPGRHAGGSTRGGRVCTDLLRLHEVGHVAIVVDTAGVEASAGACAADARDEAGLGLLVRGVDRADGHHPADDLQQPVAAAHLVLPQGHVQQLVPAKRSPTATRVTSPPPRSTVPHAGREGVLGEPAFPLHCGVSAHGSP